jgi:dihydrolipoamide dehydrogenase
LKDTFDVIVIGAGPGGHALAEGAARCGARTAIIEQSLWGGTCTHRGCVPTKALLACSGHYAGLRKLNRMGIHAEQPGFDFSAMKRHQRQTVKISALGVEKSLRDAGVTLLRGTGAIRSAREIDCTDADGHRHALQTRHAVIAWGSLPLLPPGIEPSRRILTSDGFLELDTLPDSVLIVGGSVIGIEFATLMAELGVKVTLVEMMGQLLPSEDEEASALLSRELARLGATIHTSARLHTIQDTGDHVRLLATGPGIDLTLTASHALICVGRKPRLDTEELNRLGIRHSPQGIPTDENGMTNVPGIHAIGDATGGIMLAHRAIQQGKALASALFGDGAVIYRDEAVPSVVYSHPQVARVGMTEKQARQQGLDIEVFRSDYAANIMARAELTGPGFVKMLFHQDHLAGATILGDGAAELIPAMSLAIANGLGKKEFHKWIIPHPTLSEVMAIVK